jgi:acetyltransferase-like isoleucine patch superfamily enzyme
MSIRYPHKHKGRITIGKNISGIEDQSVIIDNTGDIIIGDFVIFSGGCKIYTHDHFMNRGMTILEQTEKLGVKYSNLVIGDDVYFGANCIVTQTVSFIPKGTVIAAGAVLTKNPVNEYEIWGGIPAIKIGERD